MRRTRILGLMAAAAALMPAADPAAVTPPPGFSLIAASAPAIGKGSHYTVRPGDTLGGIALRSGVRVSDLAALNNIDNPNVVRIGMVLAIPTGPVAKPPTTPTTRTLVAAGTPTLRPGATGPAVADLQRRLTTAGHKVVADGAFGPKTTSAVTTFQKKKGLQPDAIVGAKTWAALGAGGTTPVSNPNPKPPTPKPVPEGPWRAFGAASYTTRAGDTWTSVAKAKGSTAEALAAANRRKTSEKLKAGTVLQVPGAWRCPVPGAIFINDWHFPRAGHLHEGTDLFAPRGRPVYAPVGGLAERSPNGLGGNAIQLHGDDGNRYYFAHLDSYGRTGKVSAGTVIGAVGNSGNAATTVTHLHFEIHPGGGAAVNPFPTLTLACKRG
jgi:murein DD-endopeptidase MepM/ murein hydrolase activator NlpD